MATTDFSNDSGVPEDELDLAEELAELWDNPYTLDFSMEELEDALIDTFATDFNDE